MRVRLSGRLLPFVVGALFLPLAVAQNLVRDVRSDIGKQDFTAAEARIGQYRVSSGVTSEMLEALSWLGRGALAAKQLDRAEAYAAARLTSWRSKCSRAAAWTPMATCPSRWERPSRSKRRSRPPAAKEARRSSSSQRELGAYRDTSIRTRIQKNIHLLSLEGKPAPDLEIREWLGPKPAGLAGLKGRVVLLFFWAHWCGDCKAQAPILARLNREYGPRGLVLVGPTARYGYISRGQDATPAEELKYIARDPCPVLC